MTTPTKTATAEDIKVGSVLINNDPRAREPEVVVTRVFPAPWLAVDYQSRTRRATVSLDRIFVDGKSRRQGYNLKPDTAE